MIMKVFHYSTKLLFIIFLLAITLFAPKMGNARMAIPENNLSYPVLISLDDGSSASGFYMRNNKNELFLVTAGHVLFKREDDNFTLKSKKAILLSQPFPLVPEEQIEIELDLGILINNKSVVSNFPRDVIVVKIANYIKKEEKEFAKFIRGVLPKDSLKQKQIVVAETEGIKKYDKVLVSNEIFIFGYPTSLGIKNDPQIDYKKPLLRKGIVAGKNDKQKTIILDCPVYQGNSGGPCVEVEQEGLQSKYLIIGVVLQFIPFEEKWLNLNYNRVNTDWENSGYSVVEPIDTVLDLIEK
ncbi:MAG: trypsin-like peptidase domain-containing protein [Candidatus Omnitrophota bacterium]